MENIPICHNDRTVFESQLHGSVPLTFGIMRTLSQDRKFLVKIPVDER